MIRTFASVWLMVLAVGGGVFETRDLIEQALDEPTQIRLEDVRLEDAIDELTIQTGVRIVMRPEVMRLAPHGAETLIQQIDIAGLPLREGLERVLAPLAMSFVVEEDHVAVVPRAGLACLGRSPSWEELDLLNELHSRQPGLVGDDLEWLRERVQMRVPAAEAWTHLALVLRNVGAGSGDEVLQVAVDNLGWSWCVSGGQVVVEARQDEIRRRLQEPVSLRINNRPLVEVLNVLGDRAGVSVRSEPGALASLPPAIQRNFSLNVSNQRAEDVLEQVAAYTGMGYLIEPDGVLFFQAAPAGGPAAGEPAGSGPPPGADPYVAKISVPLGDGTTLDWLIRLSELPPDLRDRRADDLRRAFEQIRLEGSSASVSTTPASASSSP